jgi:hypothetical protein
LARRNASAISDSANREKLPPAAGIRRHGKSLAAGLLVPDPLALAFKLRSPGSPTANEFNGKSLLGNLTRASA